MSLLQETRGSGRQHPWKKSALERKGRKALKPIRKDVSMEDASSRTEMTKGKGWVTQQEKRKHERRQHKNRKDKGLVTSGGGTSSRKMTGRTNLLWKFLNIV